MNSYLFHMHYTAFVYIIYQILSEKLLWKINKRASAKSLKWTLCYHSLDAAAMADVTRLSAGKHPPGNIYSFMKSEFCMYSEYLTSGVEMN